MIRPFTVLCLIAACGSGLYLYSEKHRTALLDRDIGRVIHETEAARARSGMLRAEWALLNEPGRLEEMAGRYLVLHPLAPTQFVPLAELASHLPSPAAAPLRGNTDDDGDASAPASTPVVAATDAHDAVPAPPDSATTHPMMAAVRTDAKPASKALANASPHLHLQRHLQLADRMERATHDGLVRGTPLPLAAPQPLGASVYSAMAHPMRVTQTRPAVVSAVPSYAPARSFVASALAGTQSLPPPVPYGR